ncbi:MAG: acyl-CoA reductase [Bacteriovoracaceae bacterium]
MYYFGAKLENLNQIPWSSLKLARNELAQIEIEKIISLLDKFSHLWEEDSELFLKALKGLEKTSSFDHEELRKTLKILPSILKRDSLEARIKAEFMNPKILDQFVKTPSFLGKVKAKPLGIVLHVTAGNVFLSCIDSLIMGFLTKNISLVKVSSQNQFFPEFFANALKEFDQENILADKFAILHWKGGDKQIESEIKKRVNAIVAWGGEEMVQNYQQNLPLGVKLLDFGPKISFQVLTKQGLENKNLKLVAEKIVSDITPWDQSACSSPQNLFIEEGVDSKVLIKYLEEAFENSPKRGQLSEDEAVEILKEKYRGLYSKLMEEGELAFGENYLLHLEKNKYLKSSPLHRSLILKAFKNIDDLVNHVEPFSYYLQSCAYLVGEKEKNPLLEKLSLAGVKRFAPIGTITWGMEGAPHDGRYVLRELTHFIVDEIRNVELGDAYSELQNSKELKLNFENSTHPEGYIFSSGGTTGEPKYVHFSYEEFDYITDMLALNLKAQGVTCGMTVANLFVAGNLWSSFIAMEKALEKIGAIQLPIGGLASQENIATYLKKFNPQIVLGIPSLLVMTAEYLESIGEHLQVNKVFYAGEALSSMRRDYLSKVWGTQYFGSAGYASVDAGIIAFQCQSCGPGEHHLFEDLVEMKIINDEAVVSSLYRTSLPIKNYRTGDRVEWIGPCSSKIPGKRFKLLGRIDNLIQIWSCRILLSDIEKSFQQINPDILTFQIKIKEELFGTGAREVLEIYFEQPFTLVDIEQLQRLIYDYSRDLKDTFSYDEFIKGLRLIPVHLIERNARTGKVSQVIDLRH